eukprot:6594293-Prymnesium_polylepis.1
MASSTRPNAPDEMDQLVALQRSGILSMSEFLRMSREINKKDAERLAEARGKINEARDVLSEDDGSAKSSRSEMLVDESGDLYNAAEAATLDNIGDGEEGGSDAGSFDNTPSEDRGDNAVREEGSDDSGNFDPEPDRTRTSSNQPHHLRRNHRRSLSDFINDGKARISASIIKPGCKHKREMKSFWVNQTELTL